MTCLQESMGSLVDSNRLYSMYLPGVNSYTYASTSLMSPIHISPHHTSSHTASHLTICTPTHSHAHTCTHPCTHMHTSMPEHTPPHTPLVADFAGCSCLPLQYSLGAGYFENSGQSKGSYGTGSQDEHTNLGKQTTLTYY